MRYLLPVSIICLAAWSVPSGAADSYGIVISGFGIMSGHMLARDGMSSTGIEHRASQGSGIIETTTRIPACIGTRFGIMFSIVGAPDLTPLPLVDAYIFPSAGLRKPGLPSPIHDALFNDPSMPGSSGNAVLYEFDEPWELVPGKWVIGIRDGNRLLASKTFTVVAPNTGECLELSA